MKVLRNEEGQSLVLTAICMAVLIGFVALATDVGLMLRQRRVAQTVADSAAVAAASESWNEGNPSSVTAGMLTAANHDVVMNGLTPGANGVNLNVVTAPNITVAGYNSLAYVQATVTLTTSTFFMNFFGRNFFNISATAIASDGLPAIGCFDIQNEGNYADPAGTMSGSSEVFGNDCGVTINGNLNMTGNANINAEFVAASGTITNGGSSTVTGGPISQGVPPANDPLPALQTEYPTAGTTAGGPCGSSVGGMYCVYNYNNGVLSGLLPQTPAGYTGTIYYFDSNVNGGNGPTISGTVSGTNMSIFLAGNIPLDFANNGSLTISPVGYGIKDACPPNGPNPLCGVLIDAPTDGSNGNGTYTCTHGHGNNYGNPGEMYFDFGSSTTDLEGIIYAPNMQLFIQDQGANTTLDNDVIVGNFCSQAATLSINGYNPQYSPLTKVGLVY